MKSVAAGPISRALGQITGFSALDMAVAVVVCLLIVVTAMELFTSSNLTLSLHRQVTDVQDGGRYAADLLSGQIRYAGSESGALPAVVFPAAADAAPAALSSTPAGSIDGGAAGSDTLVIQYRVGDWDSRRAGDLGQPVRRDCAGRELARGSYIVERFYLSADPVSGEGHALLCHAGTYQLADGKRLVPSGVAPAPVVLAHDVDSFQVLYGVDGVGKPGEALRPTAYMTASQYSAAFPRHDSPVLSVAFSLLVRAKASGKGHDVSPAYQVLDVRYAPGAFPDKGYARRIYQSTVRLRNVVPGAGVNLVQGGR